MEKRFEYILILAVGIAGLILVAASQQVSAYDISGLWKLNANGERADLTIKVTPGESGLITGTAHWFGKPGPEPFTQNVTGFWDTNTGKIVFLTENKVIFDKPRPAGTPHLICNTITTKSASPAVIDNIQAALKLTTPDRDEKLKKALDPLEPCHGRDVGFTGYLFGDNAPQKGMIPEPSYKMMAGVEQVFDGSSQGVGGSPVRNTFGWCATLKDEMCGPPIGPTLKASALNATSMSNTTSALNATSMSNASATAK